MSGNCSRCGRRFAHIFTQRYPLPDGGVWCGSCDPDDPAKGINPRVATETGVVEEAPSTYLCLTEKERIRRALDGLGCVMDGPHAGAWVPAQHDMIEMPILGTPDYTIPGEPFVPNMTTPRNAIYRRVQRSDGRLYFYIEQKRGVVNDAVERHLRNQVAGDAVKDVDQIMLTPCANCGVPGFGHTGGPPEGCDGFEVKGDGGRDA